MVNCLILYQFFEVNVQRDVHEALLLPLEIFSGVSPVRNVQYSLISHFVLLYKLTGFPILA